MVAGKNPATRRVSVTPSVVEKYVMQKYIITYGADNDTAKIEATSVEHAIDQFNNMPNRPGAIVGIDLIVPYLDWPTSVEDRTMAGVGNRPEDATGFGAQFDHLTGRFDPSVDYTAVPRPWPTKPDTVSASFWDGLSASDKEFVAQHEAIHAECDKAAASRLLDQQPAQTGAAIFGPGKTTVLPAQPTTTTLAISPNDFRDLFADIVSGFGCEYPNDDEIAALKRLASLVNDL